MPELRVSTCSGPYHYIYIKNMILKIIGVTYKNSNSQVYIKFKTEVLCSDNGLLNFPFVQTYLNLQYEYSTHIYITKACLTLLGILDWLRPPSQVFLTIILYWSKTLNLEGIIQNFLKKKNVPGLETLIQKLY